MNEPSYPDWMTKPFENVPPSHMLQEHAEGAPLWVRLGRHLVIFATATNRRTNLTMTGGF